MNYIEQKKFLMGSRLWGGAWVSALLLVALFCLSARIDHAATAAFFILIALAIFMYYTPDYLHLTANPDKRPRWAIKIRWRVIAALLIGGLVFSSSLKARAIVLLSVLCLILVTVIAKKLPSPSVAICLCAGEFIILAVLLLSTSLNFFVGTALLAFACHLAIVVSSHTTRWAATAGGIALLISIVSTGQRHITSALNLLFVLVLVASILGTAMLVVRTQRRNKKI